MKRHIKNLWLNLNFPRSIPAIICLFISKSKNVVFKDVERWIAIQEIKDINSKWKGFRWLMLYSPEFRNLFYCRIKKHNYLMGHILTIFYRPLNTLHICTENIGEGLYIQHGFSTIITAKEIGKNCFINQQVTVGYDFTGIPTIGDNVRITSGAKIFGNITIGDNTMIGSNCVVNKDVPGNCTVVGIPGRIVKKDGKRVDIAL